MNNEPVAWRRIEENGWYVYYETECLEDLIPLYTHPSEHDLGVAEAIGFDKGYKAATAKTLTDEEILEVAQKMGWRGALGFLINFARAILRKAQENG